MTEVEKINEIEICKIVVKRLRSNHFSWDILIRPFRIMYYELRIKKLEKENKNEQART